ncbi:DltD N-terminal domain protein [Lophiostoma macrostomum CBS 122681]|uniref:DltD N-terminal domain protein n=1 Tax=Lophiostoma macrostomum CBS 122681 TaxID=1314788 RepID=A0A6A6SJC7_9PLEO|nr:DltD N-terminal domain protein [Lophiostoma macrostomum CBS 122681]
MDAQRRDVEFQTLDGLTLRGWLFTGTKGGPAVVVNGAFNTPKEIFASEVAAWFGRQGVNALVYDARTLGVSDGLPRNDLDPQKFAEDIHDAVTFLQNDGWVDPHRIALWGFFYSTAVVLEAAAFDKRVAAVILQGLMPEWSLNPPDEQAVIERAIKDRVNRQKGDAPDYVPLINEKGEHFLLFENLARLSPEQKTKLPDWVELAKKLAPTFNDRLTIQSFYRHAKWRPLNFVARVSPTPVMILTPEFDEMVSPKFQREIFDSIQSKGKRFEILKGKGHTNLLENVSLDDLLGSQLAFLKDVLEF